MDYNAEFIDKTIEILKNRLYFSLVKLPVGKRLKTTRGTLFVCFDDEFKYRSFFQDFGPLNISCLYKYSCKMSKLLETFRGKKRIVHYTSHEPNRKVNMACLLGCFSVVYLQLDPFDVYKKLLLVEPFKQYVDALQRTSIHTIRLYDCLAGVAKAFQYNLFDFCDFNVYEYDLYDQLDRGNMNWIIPRKFLGFLGPTDRRMGVTHHPSFYLEYFLNHDVKTVIRLNDKLYNPIVFSRMGIEHYDLFFEDGSVPSVDIMLNFLRITETAPAAIAIHCKAGLGRTGTLIAAYMIKHYNMTAREAIAWLRICRPGSVTGAQQSFLEDRETWLWKSGTDYRMRHYGDDNRTPQHKYGIYSKQWPADRARIINEARKKVVTRPIRQLDEKQYLKHVTKLLSTMKTLDDFRVKKIGKTFTTMPKYKL